MTLLIILALAVIGGGAAAGYIASLVKKAPEFDLNAITDMAATTKVFDNQSEFMFELQGDGDRELIKNIDEVSPFVVNAFIAAEDKNFRNHFGINPLAMARAAVQNVIGGSIVSGASTITQQTIKNAIFPDQQRTIERKVQEAALAVQLEQRLTKDEIMVAYLNWIYFGKSGPENLYGIKRAANEIFGVDAKDLNLAQATILASLPNNPSLFNPYVNLDNTLKRQEYILQEMLTEQYITKAQYDEAKAYNVQEALQKQLEKRQVHAGEFSHLYSEIETRAAEKMMETGNYDTLDQARQALFRGGYKIVTTIDRQAQKTVDTVLDNDEYYPANISYSVTGVDGKTLQIEDAMEQSGATLIDNQTGRILAMGGGRHYEKDQINHATRPRQPGSTMKPIGVYGPAIDLKKLGAGSAIDDVPMVWPDDNAADGKYFPFNWDKKFHGLMSARYALEQSYNIPALKVFHDITPQVGLDYVKKMGVTTIGDNDYNLSAGIGGLTQGLTVAEATSAYSVFPNAGVHRESYLVEEIRDRDNNVVYKHQPKQSQVFNANTAYIVNDMLKGVVTRGTAAEVGRAFPGYAIAGKTGTTNEDKDAWFIGYTPDVTLGIWVGYNVPYPLQRGEGNLPKKLWTAIMQEQFKQDTERTKTFFADPGGVKRVEICSLSGKIPTDLCKKEHTVTTELFPAGGEPTEKCDVHVKAKYYEVGDKKYLADDHTPAYMVKEGIFIKREKYELPNDNKAYLPSDHDKELPEPRKPGEGDDKFKTESVPDGLTVTGTTDTSVSLSWNAVTGSANYLVLRAESEAGPFQIQGETTHTSYTDAKAQKNVTYWYEIVSLDKDGNHSNPTSAVSATPGQEELMPPSFVDVQPSAVGLKIVWSPVERADAYTIYRSMDRNDGYQKIGTVSETSFSDVGALPGATFYYKITAHAGTQESAPSYPISNTVPASSGNSDGSELRPPSSLSVTNQQTGNSLLVKWSAVDGATLYSVERSTDGTNWQEVGQSDKVTYTDSGLTTNLTYYYRVRSLSGDGQASTASQPASGAPTK
ncbi:MAG TPA: PBP1A family penicillin-binding protein [Bacilli bacterium]|nr:PBP1A family penicillin-binding protein [Bacilli bacterium]